MLCTAQQRATRSACREWSANSSRLGDRAMAQPVSPFPSPTRLVILAPACHGIPHMWGEFLPVQFARDLLFGLGPLSLQLVLQGRTRQFVYNGKFHVTISGCYAEGARSPWTAPPPPNAHCAASGCRLAAGRARAHIRNKWQRSVLGMMQYTLRGFSSVSLFLDFFKFYESFLFLPLSSMLCCFGFYRSACLIFYKVTCCLPITRIAPRLTHALALHMERWACPTCVYFGVASIDVLKLILSR